MATVEELKKAEEAAAGSSATNTATTMTAPAWYSGSGASAIESMFEAQKDAQLKQLESSYNQSMAEAKDAKEKISPLYQTQANDLSVQYERNKRNFNQQAAGNGINTGTASQAGLAQNSAYQRDFGALRRAEANALTDADKGMANMTAKYQDGIAAAAADIDYKKAAALLDEYNAEYNKLLARAEQLASYGDFSGYETLYGKTEAKRMKNAWIASNPQLAFMTGAINEVQYDNLINGLPMNYSGDGGSSGGREDEWSYGGSGWNPNSQLEIGGKAPADFWADYYGY